MYITVTPKQLVEELKACLSVKRVPYITSSPGIGKSTIVKDLAAKVNLKLLDLRLSQCTPEDLQGYPMRQGNKAVFTPFDIFPLNTEKKPDNINGWLLLLDELSSANKAVQAAAYKVILDRQVGSFHLHDDLYMVACGNKITDKAVVNKMSTALQSRLIHYELEMPSDEWIDWAIKKDFDYRILGYIQFKPNMLMNFDPNHTDKTYPCPRTWEFLNDLIKDKELDEIKSLPRIAGTVGAGAAVEFLTFCNAHENMPKWEDLLDPEINKELLIAEELSTKYAIISMVSSQIDKKDIVNILSYVKRYSPDLQIIFCRNVISRYPNIDEENIEFSQYAMEMITDLQDME